MRIRGVRGVNRLDFLGRIGRRSVQPGVYMLSLTRASSRRPVGQPLLVQVVSSRRTVLLGDAQARRAACDNSAALASRSPLAPFTLGLAFLPSRQPLPAPQSGSPTAEPAVQASTPPRPERGHVLGANVDLPALPSLDAAEPWGFAALVLLIGLPLLLISVLVVRFLRGSWNP
jgi:hypothetical protein